MFYLFDLASQSVVPLAQVEDMVNSVAWSPDGRWLVYSAESGLWGLDVIGALQGHTGPGWISPQPVIDLNWK
jgi:hypothetical protein